MTKLYIITGIIIAIGIIVSLFGKENFADTEQEKEKKKYNYTRKNFFLSMAEHKCFDALIEAVGNEYFVFAQVHLPTLLENKVKGQSWKAAFSHISQKSVDFVLCDNIYISPKLAIELDDRTHEQEGRKLRDIEVERILSEAGVPLLRLENHGIFDPDIYKEKIKQLALK